MTITCASRHCQMFLSGKTELDTHRLGSGCCEQALALSQSEVCQLQGPEETRPHRHDLDRVGTGVGASAPLAGGEKGPGIGRTLMLFPPWPSPYESRLRFKSSMCIVDSFLTLKVVFLGPEGGRRPETIGSLVLAAASALGCAGTAGCGSISTCC